MDALAETASPSEKPYIDLLHEPTRGVALGFRQWTTAETLADKEKALDYLTGARNALRKLRTEQRELANDPSFVQFALGIEGQIISLQEQIARDRGDPSGAALLAQQSAHLLDDMLATLGPDEPMRHYFEAMKLFQEALPKFSMGMQSLLEMNLDLAQQYLEESSKSFSPMQDHLSKAKVDALVIEGGKYAAEGFRLFASGQDTYVRTLRAAIIGEVNRTDVEALAKAEKAIRDGGELISKAAGMMPGLFGAVDFKPAARQSSQLTHNLHTLCERSLSPKEITRTTAPKAVFYFVGTFIVLLIGLPISGLVKELQSSDLGLLLIVSLFVSVIGAFGLQAIRLVPLFEVLTRLLPWARRSREENGKAP
jgi:hypothetical protein